jgi:LL-diaminopimelate aminotransferase
MALEKKKYITKKLTVGDDHMADTTGGFRIPKPKRVQLVPPYLFARISKAKEEVMARGVDVISLGIGDPDSPTPDEIVDEMCAAARVNTNQKYPKYLGTKDFKEAVADFYKRRYDVDLEADPETMCLIGSKEAIVHFILGIVDIGDYVLVPDPGYPAYEMGTHFAGGIPYKVPLTEESGFVPDLSAIPEDVANKAVLMFVNYPNNPTSAMPPDSFYQDAVDFCRKYNIVLANDNAYSEIYYGDSPPSVLQIPGAKEMAVEFNSHSKTFNMTGWRVGYVAGGAGLIKNLEIVKTNVDSGVFTPIQIAAAKALRMPLDRADGLREMYWQRRKLVEKKLAENGYHVFESKGTFYIWIKTPGGKPSIEFCADLLQETGVVCGPGRGWGEHGEGWFRICLTVDDDRMNEALERIIRFG